MLTVWSCARHSATLLVITGSIQQLARPDQKLWEWGRLYLPLKWPVLRQLYLQIVNGHGQDSVGSLAGVRPTSGLNIPCIYNMYWNLPFCSLTCLMKIYFGRFMDNDHSLFHPLPNVTYWVQTSCPVRPEGPPRCQELHCRNNPHSMYGSCSKNPSIYSKFATIF